METLSPADFENFMRDVPRELQREWDCLTQKEKEIVVWAIKDSKIRETLHEVDFRETPVPPEEFFTDPYYVGEELVWNPKEEKGLYPRWQEELCYVLNPDNEVFEWILSGGLGGGKTTVAILALLYKVYWLSCLRNPHAYIGFARTVPIDIILFNINLRTSAESGINRFEIILNDSPYFRETFPASRRKRRRGYGGTDLLDYKLELPPYIRVLEASRETHSISRDVMSGMLDEVNFVPQAKGTGSLNYDSTSKAFSLYEGLKSRINSRFMRDGKVAGSLLCLCSSAATEYDFLEQHKRAQRKKIEEAASRGDKAHVHITEFALYDLISWRFKGPRFPVLLGSEQSNSRIITSEEAPSFIAQGKTVLEIPEVFRERYEADLPRALKEVSGIPSEVVSPLFPVREQVKASIDRERKHPFTVESPIIGHLSGPPLETYLLPHELAVWSGGGLAPRHYPGSARVIHVDLSKTECATGISMGCVCGYKEVKSPNVYDPKSDDTTIAPIIWIDFTLRITPPPAPEEIGYEKIHAFINYIRNQLNFTIACISFDGYQSVMMAQILQNEGYNTKELSVDKKPDPYFALKGAILEGRLSRYEYAPLERELYGLRLLAEGNKVWIEKPAGGEKDCSDSLAGVAQHCNEMIRESYSPPMRPFTTPSMFIKL